jgi:IS5 family transposase
LSAQKKQKSHYSGKKKCHTQKAQVIVNQKTLEIIATAFCNGKTHDFKLFKDNYAGIDKEIICLADGGYQGLTKIHSNSETPTKKSKKHPLTDEQKEKNRLLSSKRIFCEHVIGKLKIFRILKERYRNRRKRFSLRFNLISALYNLALVTK